MDIYYIASWLVCTVYIFIGLYIYRADPKSSLNRMFLLFNLTLAANSVCNLAMNLTRGTIKYDYWYMGATLSWSIYASLVLYLSLVLTKREGWIRKFSTYLIFYLPVPLIMIAEFLYVRDINPANSTAYIIANSFEYIYFFGYPLAALINIYTWGRKAKRLREKKQAYLILWAGLATLVLSILVTLDIYSFETHILPDMSHIVNLIFAIAVWYAIYKYRLINIRALVSTEDVVAMVTDLIFITDDEEKIVWMNKRCYELLGYGMNEKLGSHIGGIVEGLDISGMSAAGGALTDPLCSLRKSSGGTVPVSVQISAVPDTVGEMAGNVVICKDMTLVLELQNEIAERREKERRLNYLSLHDTLTGVFNRRCFEQDMIRLEGENNYPCGIVVCDVDGLKFVNDTMGHSAGDQLLIKASDILTEAFGTTGTVYRIGGDEFAVLLSDTGIEFLKSAEKNIKDMVQAYNTENNGFFLSISIGFALRDSLDVDILETFKEADNNMYREKLDHIKSTRSSMTHGLVRLLEARDFITEGHADRMRDLVAELGKYIGLSESEITDLRLLAQFHDIGKVGIPDRILFKQGRLNASERAEMQLHSQIGYRISKSIPELSSIADLILKHHERWDGKGYPLGIKGIEIPLECRILAVVDAFDAMTYDRPYRKAMTQEAAIEELAANAGTQFDSGLVEEFIEMLGGKNHAGGCNDQPRGDRVQGG